MGIGDWNDFMSYVYRSGLGVKVGQSKPGTKKTHLLLNGGILSVPPEREQEFLDRYAMELAKGTDLYVVEMKTEPCFYFMSEFDIRLPDRVLTPDEILRIVKVLQSVINQAFPDSENGDTNIAVSTSPPKLDDKLRDNTPCIKTGLHFNWHIPLSVQDAWIMRAWIVRELDKQLPSKELGMCETWTEAYDPCVLLDNGLRMVGSKKAAKCKKCHGKPTDGCPECKNIGRIDYGRPYSLSMVYDRDGNAIPDAITYFNRLENISELVRFLSIRCPQDDHARNVTFTSAAFETYIRDAAAKERQSYDKAKSKAGKQVQDKKKPPKDTKPLEDIVPDDPLYRDISNYILSEFNGAPIVAHIKKTAGKYIVNTRSHWCENKQGEHAGSFVYFIIRPGGCCQRCFCQKTYGNKCCAAFESKPHKVPRELVEALFPASILAFKRKEDRFNRMASAILLQDETYYEPSDGIALPLPTAQAARRLITPKKDYAQIRDEIMPIRSVSSFVEALRAANFNK